MTQNPELRSVVQRMIDAGESEENIGAVIQRMTATTPAPGDSNHPAAPEPSMLSRVASGAGNAIVEGVKGIATASGIPGFLREGPIGAIKDQAGLVGGLLGAQFDQYTKAKAAQAEGRTSEMIGHSVAAAVPGLGPMAARWGEMAGGGQGPEAVGEGLVAAVTPFAPKAGRLTMKAAKDGFAARAATKAGKATAAVEGDFMLSIPPTKSAPYTGDDFRAAKPYLNAQQRKLREDGQPARIESTVAAREALDNAIGEIETHIGTVLESFPETRLNPLAKVRAAVSEAFSDNPRGGAMASGVKELDDLPLNGELTLGELDRIRLQLNAENTAVLKRNNYDQATARKVDNGFIAREATARAIRDVLYDYLEERGVRGLRELRRDEGSLIKLRNAAARQEMSGHRQVGAHDPSMTRKVAAGLTQAGATAAGAAMAGPAGAVGGAVLGNELAATIKGSRRTRDELVARAFAAADDRLPTLPSVPARRPSAGALPPAPIRLGAVPDTSYARGVPAEPARRIVRGELPPATTRFADAGPDTSGPAVLPLPENINNPRIATDRTPEALPDAKAPATERAFMLRWLADDLSEMQFQKGGTTKGARRVAYDELGELSAEERKALNFNPRVAGTPTQEMFHAAGITGSRPRILKKMERIIKGKSGDPRIEALGDALVEAFDGQRFDWDLVSDATLVKAGIRRRDLRAPISSASDSDMPSVHARLFGKRGGDDFEFKD